MPAPTADLRRPATALSLVILSLALVAAMAPVASAAGCFGRSATISGTSGKDQIRGTGGGDVIVASSGNDVVFGRSGKDRICLGAGNDATRGHSGGDRINGGKGDDLLFGDTRKDLLVGGGGDDILAGDSGADRLKGGGGRFDVLLGGPDDDQLRGGGGQDILLGADGDDLLNGGGTVFDVASFFLSPVGVNGNLATGLATGEGNDRVVGVEAFEGSPQNDTFIGNDADNFFWDYLGDDLMDGAGGLDLVTFFNSETAVTANLATDTASGQGTDSIPNIEDLAGTFHSGDSLTGDAETNLLIAFEGDDTLNGAEGDDVLFGDPGVDAGNGGPHVTGDRCIEIEAPTDCEFFSRDAGRRPMLAAGRPMAYRSLGPDASSFVLR